MQILIKCLLGLILVVSLGLNIAYFLDEDCLEYKEARPHQDTFPSPVPQKVVIQKDETTQALPIEKSDASNLSYEELQEQTEDYFTDYLIRTVGISSKQAGEAMEIIRQIDIEVAGYVKARAEEYTKKYGVEDSYIYQAEDYIFLGQARLRAREKLKNLMGDERWREFFIHIQEYNQGKISSGPVSPIDI